MRNLVRCLCLVVGTTYALPASWAAPLIGTVTWNNGDALEGQLAGLQDGLLMWSSPRFGATQRIDVDFIESVDFPGQASRSGSTEPFRVQMSTGDVLFGRLAALTERFLTLDTERLGKVRLKREFIRELRQLRHTQVIYDGPRWLDGWRVLKAGRRISEWTATEHGHLHTAKYGAELFHDLPELDVAEINLALTWSGKPGFQIDFSAPGDLVSSRPKPKLSIKSWGNDVVAQSALDTADFQHLLKLTDRQKELRLRIIWDHQAGEVLVTGEAGRELSRVAMDKSTVAPGFGVLVKNRSDDLTLEQIRVSKWNGTAHSKDRKPGESFLRLADGTLLVGSVTNLEGTDLRISPSQQTVSLNDLAVAEFLPTETANVQTAHLRFQDGAELAGRLTAITDSVAIMETPLADERIEVSLIGLESLRFFQGKTSEYDFHLHFSDGKRLSGTLAAVGNSQQLGWQSVGSPDAVAIVDPSAMIERRMGQRIEEAPRWGGEIVYFHDGSIITGNVHSISESALALETPFAPSSVIPLADTVRAVELIRAAGRISFTSERWEFLRESRPLQRSQERLEVSDQVSFRDLDLVHAGKISFDCSWDEEFVGLITIYLGTSTKLPRGGVARLTISRDRMTARCLLKPTVALSLPPIPDRRATVSLVAEGKQLSVWVNGILAIDTQLGSEISPQGIWIQCGSAKGTLSRAPSDQPDTRLVLAQLRVGDSASQLGRQFASSEALSMILSLPRNLREAAPATVLCASNGDFLRGYLMAMDDEHVRFRSKYEDVTVPREDVSALVWLRLASVDGTVEAQPPQSSRVLVTLVDGSTYSFQGLGLVQRLLLGHHAAVGDCRIPVDRLLKLEFDHPQHDAPSVLDWRLVATPEPSFEDPSGGGLNSPYIGFDTQNVVIPLLDGDPLTLGSLRGKIVVLDFWATWCAPCIRSLPKLVALTERFPDNTVALVAVNQEETPFTIKTFQASRDLDMTVGLDPELKIADQFGVENLPHTVIIGPDGKVERVFVGSPSDLHEDITQAITELLPPAD